MANIYRVGKDIWSVLSEVEVLLDVVTENPHHR